MALMSPMARSHPLLALVPRFWPRQHHCPCRARHHAWGRLLRATRRRRGQFDRGRCRGIAHCAMPGCSCGPRYCRHREPPRPLPAPPGPRMHSPFASQGQFPRRPLPLYASGMLSSGSRLAFAWCDHSHSPSHWGRPGEGEKPPSCPAEAAASIGGSSSGAGMGMGYPFPSPSSPSVIAAAAISRTVADAVQQQPGMLAMGQARRLGRGAGSWNGSGAARALPYPCSSGGALPRAPLPAAAVPGPSPRCHSWSVYPRPCPCERRSQPWWLGPRLRPPLPGHGRRRVFL